MTHHPGQNSKWALLFLPFAFTILYSAHIFDLCGAFSPRKMRNPNQELKEWPFSEEIIQGSLSQPAALQMCSDYNSQNSWPTLSRDLPIPAHLEITRSKKKAAEGNSDKMVRLDPKCWRFIWWWREIKILTAAVASYGSRNGLLYRKDVGKDLKTLYHFFSNLFQEMPATMFQHISFACIHREGWGEIERGRGKERVWNHLQTSMFPCYWSQDTSGLIME